MQRQTVHTGTAWEPVVGYSRAVRVGDVVHVSGTTATDEDGALVGEGDAGRQAEQILANVGRALERVGAGFSDVVRTRMYVVDASDWEAVGRAHGAVFGDVRPASTLVAVKALVDPRMLVEIEVEAIVGS